MLQDMPGQWINLKDENNSNIPDKKIRSCKLSNVRDGTVIRVKGINANFFCFFNYKFPGLEAIGNVNFISVLDFR